MAQNKVFKFSTIEELQHFMNGAVIGSKDLGQGVSGLIGKTLIVNGTTVTFVATANPDTNFFYFKDIHTQIQAAVATVTARSIRGKLVLIVTTASGGVTITSTGTANDALGFSTVANTVGKVYTPPGVTVVGQQWTVLEAGTENYILTTWE